MAAKKRCQFTQGETQCNSAVLRMIGDCPHCKNKFCGEHRMPEHHNCSNLENCRAEAFAKNKAKLESEQTIASKLTTV